MPLSNPELFNNSDEDADDYDVFTISESYQFHESDYHQDCISSLKDIIESHIPSPD